LTGRNSMSSIGSKTFFADIGDKVIYDDFTLRFNVVAEK
jgi:hypothetical protein